MLKLNSLFLAAFALLAVFVSDQACCAQEPNWYPFVIARGEDRAVIENTPMELRPYRPLHFYGNTVRRNYYRGNPFPMPRDWARGTAITMQRRQFTSPF